MSEILIFDTETNGLPLWKERSEADGQPHIVQLAGILADEKTGKINQSMDVIIKPDGWKIPQDTVDIHGITTEYALNVGVPEKLALEMFLDMWSGRTRVAHGVGFDNRIIRIGTKRYFNDDVIDAWHGCDNKCTGRLSKEPMGVKGRKIPKLADAHKHFFGVEHENQHTAMGDALACHRIYFEIQRLATGGADLDEQQNIAFNP